MYKSFKLAMVMAIVLTVSGCVVVISDENDAVEYTSVNSNNLDGYLSADGNEYEMTGNLILDVDLYKPVIVQGNLDLNVNWKNVSNITFIIETGSTLIISGTASAINFDIDGGTLIINSNISVKGSMNGGTIQNNAQITIKTTFNITSGQIINNDKITSQVESPSSRTDVTDNNGLFIEYTKIGNEFSLTKVSTGEGVTDKEVNLLAKIDNCSVTSIGESAFENCLGVTSVMKPVVSNSLSSIGDRAFYGCSNLEKVVLDKVTGIGDDVFIGCSNLTDLTFNSLTSVDADMFEGCTSLEKLTVSESCVIPEGAFQGFDNLTVVKGNTSYYIDADGNLGEANADNANFAIYQNSKIYYYIDFDTAISSAVNGVTITVLKSIEIEPLQIEKTTLIIDLNGNKLTIVDSISEQKNTSTYGIDFIGGTLTIKNGDIVDARDSTDRKGSYTAVNSMGNLNIVDVDLTIYDAKNTSNSNNIGYRITSSQTLTISGNSTITTNSTTDADCGSVGVVVLGFGNMVNTTNLVLEDDATISVGQYGISGNGTVPGADSSTDYRGTTITIRDNAKVTAANGWGIYHPQDGTLNIQDDAYVSGLTGIEIRSGTLNMTGGTVESIATGAGALAIDPDSSGATTTGVGIAVVQHSTKLYITVDVSGGDVKGYYAVFQEDVAENGDESAQKIDITLRSGSFESTGTESVTVGDKTYAPSAVYGEQEKDMVVGGNYSTDVSDYIAEGSVIQQNPDGSFVVSSEEDSQLPYPPIWDDDEYVPPIYVPSQTNNDDDTVKIVACAAAAVVAAIMAAFLILGQKKD